MVFQKEMDAVFRLLFRFGEVDIKEFHATFAKKRIP